MVIYMKKILFRTLCVLTVLSVLCTCYVIFDYYIYSTRDTENKIDKLNNDIEDTQKKIDEEKEKKEKFILDNKEKAGKLEVWQKELEKVD